MGECRDLKGSVVRSVVLGIRLVGATVRNRDQIAKEALENKKVQKAIHDAFRKQAGAMINASLTGETLDGKAAKTFVESIAKAAHPHAAGAVKKQKEYAEASQGLKDLKCAFDETPVGIFVNKNKTWLIIAGVVVAAGGAVAMYLTKSGDVPAKGLTFITEQAAKKIEVGAVTFGVKDLDFVPTKQNVKGTVEVSMGSLETAKVNFDLRSAVKGGTLEELSLSETVVVPLSKQTKLTGKAGIGMKERKPTYDLALAVKHSDKGFTLDVAGYLKGVGTEQTFGAKATAGYRIDTSRLLGPKSRTTIGATGNIEATRASGRDRFQMGGGVNVGLTATFW
jgi:hypothetical protein